MSDSIEDVVVPHLGATVSSARITRWLVEPGASVIRGQALAAISIDKVDAEISSPSEGILSEILKNEGETVPVGTTIALISSLSESTSAEIMDHLQKARIRNARIAEGAIVIRKAPAEVRITGICLLALSLVNLFIELYYWEDKSRVVTGFTFGLAILLVAGLVIVLKWLWPRRNQ